MSHITILQDGKIIAEHSTDSPLASYGQAVWHILEPEPCPGPAVWSQGGVEQQLDVLCVRHGWLICRQAHGLLCGVIWSDGSYYANLLVDDDNEPQRDFRDGLHVRDTVYLGEGLGAVLPGATSGFNFGERDA